MSEDHKTTKATALNIANTLRARWMLMSFATIY